MRKLASLTLLIFICMTVSVSAHPGSLDENGGHYNHKTGEYHYHDGTNTGSGGSGSSSSDVEYDNVIFEDEVSGIKFLVPKGDYIETASSATNIAENTAKKSKDDWDAAQIFTFIFFGIIIVVCILYYGAPLFSRISDFIYEKIFEKHLPRYNLWMYEQTMDSIKHYAHELNCFKRIIDDFHEIGIPDIYEIGSDDLPKEKGCSDWGKKFTAYRSKHSKKLHVQYNCCNATEKCHIYQAFLLSFDPYNSLCKKCSQYYKIPDLKWYQTYKEFPQAKKNYVVYREALDDLYQKLYTYNKKCNSTYMKFLMSFNKNNLNKLQTLNCSMQQLIN